MNRLAIVLSLVMALPSSAFAQSTPSTLTAEQYQAFVKTIDMESRVLSVDRFLEMRGQENTVVLDLRTLGHYNQSHIEGAVHFGMNIQLEILRSLVPDPNTTILLYCSNSIYPTRMISLTYISLPQFMAQGYDNTYMLRDWFDGGNIADLPMTGE